MMTLKQMLKRHNSLLNLSDAATDEQINTVNRLRELLNYEDTLKGVPQKIYTILVDAHLNLLERAIQLFDFSAELYDAARAIREKLNAKYDPDPATLPDFVPEEGAPF